MRKTHLKPTIVSIVFAGLSLILFLASLQNVHATFAQQLGGSSTPTPITLPSPVPGNSIRVPIVISQEGSNYTLTPYQLSIPSNTQGIVWVNRTNTPQFIINDDNLYKLQEVPSHGSLKLDLPYAITYHFHIKSGNPVYCTIVKADLPPAPTPTK